MNTSGAEKWMRGFCQAIGALFLWLTLFAALDLIDFHLCIKAAGHCKIIDPTVEVSK
jgi:hypothetical protein